MEKIVYFDYCAFVLLLLLLITTINRKMTQGKANHYFLILISFSLLTVIADVIAINLDRAGIGNVAEKYLSHTTYMLLHTALVPCYITYLVSLADTWHLFNRQRVLGIVAFIPYIITVILLAINPFTGFIFYVDASDTYTRGSAFGVLYVVPAVYIILGCTYLLKHRKLFTGVQFFVLISMFPILTIVSLIQFLYPEYIVELFMTSIALTYISTTIQKPEDVIDNDTGLLRLAAYVSNMERATSTNKPMEIVMVNLANYPILFDMLGYDGMNQLLHNIANQLNVLNKHQHLSANLYHLGQGKFRIIIDQTHFEQTNEIATLINKALKPVITLKQMDVSILGQICITRWPEDIDNIDSLLNFGNDLNTQPYTGQVLYTADLFKKQHYELMRDMDRIIERALIDHKFEVYYQPIYSVNEKRFNSAEALLRLKDDQYGFISPDIFIPAAEKSGAIHKIGAFVIDEVCQFISSDDYKQLGIDYIEVNLSVAQCMHSNLAKDILSTLDLYNISPEQINLEITETAASYSQSIMIDNLTKLTEAGISFSLDDYGTGYSNIRRIASLPLQLIKLDKSFTNISENPKLLVILENTVRMIKDMDLQIVVEGIETADMVKQFAALECEYIQGYYYSKPIPRNDFVAFITSTQG